MTTWKMLVVVSIDYLLSIEFLNSTIIEWGLNGGYCDDPSEILI